MNDMIIPMLLNKLDQLIARIGWQNRRPREGAEGLVA